MPIQAKGATMFLAMNHAFHGADKVYFDGSGKTLTLSPEHCTSVRPPFPASW